MPSYTAIAFYIVAHLDDWQLFMNPNISYDLRDGNNKVVIIHATGDDAGGTENYWRAKEKAAISSVIFQIAHLRAIEETSVAVRINRRMIQRWSGGNAVCYFMRLPDGNVSGEGFERQAYQSLEKLYRGSLRSITAVDGSTTYRGWRDFVNTLQGIIDYETAGITSVSLDHPETDEVINPGDHSDHRMAGLAAQAIAKYRQYRRYSHVGYHLQTSSPDLAEDDLFWKIGQFVAYDKALYDLTGYSTIQENPSQYIEWCLRKARFREVV